MTGRTGSARHELLQILTHSVAERLTVATLQYVQDAVEGRIMLLDLALQILIEELELALASALPQQLLHLGRQVVPLRIVIIAISSEHRAQLLHKIRIKVIAEAGDAALGKGFLAVRHNQRLVELHVHAQTSAVRASAEGVVKREQPRLNRRQAHATVVAGKMLAEQQKLCLLAQRRHLHEAVGQLQRRLHRISKALLNPLAHRQTVNNHRQAVLAPLIQLDILIQSAHLAVYIHAHIACTPHLVEHAHMLALASAHQRSHNHEASTRIQLQHTVDNLLHALLLDKLAALRTMRLTCTRKQQTQIIVNLRHRAHCRTRIAARRLLVDRNRRTQAFNIIHIRLIHLPQKLACIGRQRLHITALAFSVNRVEGQAALAAARKAGDDHHFITRYLYRDILQVVLTCTLNNKFFLHYLPLILKFL